MKKITLLLFATFVALTSFNKPLPKSNIDLQKVKFNPTVESSTVFISRYSPEYEGFQVGYSDIWGSPSPNLEVTFHVTFKHLFRPYIFVKDITVLMNPEASTSTFYGAELKQALNGEDNNTILSWSVISSVPQ